jgi:hypothetical protein
MNMLMNVMADGLRSMACSSKTVSSHKWTSLELHLSDLVAYPIHLLGSHSAFGANVCTSLTRVWSKEMSGEGKRKNSKGQLKTLRSCKDFHTMTVFPAAKVQNYVD